MTDSKVTTLACQGAMLSLSAELRSIAEGLELDAFRHGDNYAELNEGWLSALDRLEFEQAISNELLEGLNARYIAENRKEHDA